MGSDLMVVNCARASHRKKSSGFNERDTRLIGYLARKNHWTPFGHPQIQFRLEAPIFVARQLAKHQVGMVWNEVSRRYVDDEPEFFRPATWRKRAPNIKQGSLDEEVEDAARVKELVRGATHAASYAYRWLLQYNVAPEQARMVLPQSMMTEWVWTGSLYAFARVCKLRLDPHSQAETRVIARQIAAAARELFPVSWAALMEERA